MSEVVEQIETLIRALVDEPDSVRVSEEELEDALLLRVEVAADELGRVIGRQGNTVKALRTLLDVRGGDTDTFYELEVDEA